MKNNLVGSLICTVKNENRTISEFLESIRRQTMQPTEIVVVDGGSIDGTLETLRNYQKYLPIKVIVSNNSNISSGRNIAISNASYDFIVSTDSGCKLDEKYFENITRHLHDPEVDVVSGIYLPWTESDNERVIAEVTFGRVDRINSKFLPSSRSIAFKKSCWKKVGGYPEWLDTAEDTLFDTNLKKAGFKFVLALDAIVYWRVRNTPIETFYQYLNYSIGDGMASLSAKMFIGRAGILCFFIVLFILGFGFSLLWLLIPLLIGMGLFAIYVRKLQKITLKRISLAFAVATMIEIGSFVGYIIGLRRRLKNSHKKID